MMALRLQTVVYFRNAVVNRKERNSESREDYVGAMYYASSIERQFNAKLKIDLQSALAESVRRA